MISVWLNIDEKDMVAALREAAEKLDSADGELALDFSSVQRINSKAVQALQEFARKADEKAVKLVLRGVRVDVYKVLKLVKLAPRFSFAG
jgi:anti-anti-sigma regulatory factor